MVLNYDMSPEEIIEGKIEGIKLAEKIRYSNLKYLLCYFLISFIGLSPIFMDVYIEGRDEGVSNLIKIIVSALFITTAITFFISKIVEKYVDRRFKLAFRNSVGNIVNSHCGDIIKVSVELSETVKIKSRHRFELSYSAITALREVNDRIFIEYNKNKQLYIPKKAFNSEAEKYKFIKEFEKKHKLYKNKCMETLKKEDFEVLLSYKMDDKDIENISRESENTILSKKIYSSIKKKTIIIEGLFFTTYILTSLSIKSFFGLLVGSSFIGIMIFCYNKVLLPISLRGHVVISIRKEIQNREVQWIGIRDGMLYFSDTQKQLVQDIEKIRRGTFLHRNGYLVHSIGESNNFYLPYKAFKDEKDREAFLSHFK